MGQNRSSAVMQQRAEPHDSLEDFPTPPWATRALLEHVVVPAAGSLDALTSWEPACNRLHMVRPLRERFATVHAIDVHDYGVGAWIGDFLFPTSFPNGRFGAPEWIITNPPFRLALQFIHRALAIATRGVAMLVRSAFLEGAGRYRDLFLPAPPSIVAQFVERVVIVKGKLSPKGRSATAYSWLVWIKGMAPAPFSWIPPCRRALERASDYETSPGVLA